MRRRDPRDAGQALVLAALCMLLVAVMVLITLSIGWRVRDRVETQLAADASAYSQAVDVARAYNELALMNRAAIAMEVSALSMSALISWSSHHRSNLVATEAALATIAAQYSAECCAIFCPCQCAEAARSAISLGAVTRELARVRRDWNTLEPAAAEQLRATWHGAAHLFDRSKAMLRDQVLETRIKHQRLAKTIASRASDELSAPDEGDEKIATEMSEALHGDRQRFHPSFYDGADAVQVAVVAMGTRGDHFTTARAGSRAPIVERLTPLVQTGNAAASVDPAVQDLAGGTAIGSQWHQHDVATVRPGMPWAEDHGGTLTVAWPSACGKSASIPVIDARLASGLANAVHRYQPGDTARAPQRHRVGDDGAVLPDMLLFAYEQVEHPENDFGQPKIYSIIDRDYRRVKSKPWDLRVQLQLGSGSQLDLNGPRSTFQSPAGADLQHQTALGSAVVYYHRPGAWVEPPNYFNPYWRATLYAADDDVKRWLERAALPQHAKAVQLLLDKGWVGTR